MNLPDTKIMYEALLNKDASFEGIFFVAVKTTGIFCRPTCTARKPKKENVVFYQTSKEALDLGFRPCKVCKPMVQFGASPEWLKPILEEVSKTPEIKLKDQDLRERGVDPARLRRWFQKHHGMTFQAYTRSLRINKAFGNIKHGEKVISSAYDSGYESLSGFTDAFNNTTGFSPNKSKNKQIVNITRVLTPLGPMLAGATEKGICLLEFTDRKMLETQINRLQKLLKAVFMPGINKHFEILQLQLNEYFEGKRKVFDLPLDIPGSEFQKQVWDLLQNIPYGKTRSYQDQAIGINNPKAIRAVGKANGDNRISIIIPCHRVIGKDGNLTGYGGKIWRKKYLLDLEKSYL